MKKIMLTVAGMLFAGVLAVNAQVTEQSNKMTQDTTGVADQSSTGVVGEDQSNFTRDMEVIQSTDVPETLRSTLGGSEYSGWEEGKVYRNTSTNEYLIVIGDEDAKVYRFDSNGQRIEDLGQQSGEAGSQMSPGTGDAGTGDMGAGSTETTDGTGTTGSQDAGSTDSGAAGTTGTGSTTDQTSGTSNTR